MKVIDALNVSSYLCQGSLVVFSWYEKHKKCPRSALILLGYHDVVISVPTRNTFVFLIDKCFIFVTII